MTASPLVSVSARQEALVRIPLLSDWEMAAAAGQNSGRAPDKLRFVPVQMPGTAASALRARGEWRPGCGTALDATDYWFRCTFDSEPAAWCEEVMLELGGIATLSEVWLNGRHILKSSSMFARHEIDVSELLGARNELLIVCRSLATALRGRRGQQPAARWRTRVVSEQQLRWFRTTLLGRAPGFASEPAPVGPWRPVTLIRRQHLALERWARRVETDGTTGMIHSEIRLRTLQPDARPVDGWLRSGEIRSPIEWEESGGGYTGRAVLRIPNARRWWPHTHGTSALYPLRLEVQLRDGSEIAFDDVPVGFRELAFTTAGTGQAGFKVNGVPVFCRGVVWTPPDAVALACEESRVRQQLELLQDAGFNLIRIAGTTAYEDETFHRLCDELGLLVWQDLMFANMDYPFADPDFMEAVRSETECELTRLSRHASSAMICGNSEIEQQVSMLGLDAREGRAPFFGEELPRIVAQCCPGLPYITSAPSGGDLPFRARRGVANYFGVGAYLRPLDDVRRADVGFASECLAFSNVPEAEAMDKMALGIPGGISPSHPAWKRGIPRDSGAGWDFEDVRDHYLKLLYEVDPAALRHSDPQRYWELSRAVSGEIMAEAFGEWRRSGSRCGGGIVLWSTDLEPGAGWGILDSDGRPKPVYWYLKRALAPLAVWTTDEGLNGIDVHVSNDASAGFHGVLRIAMYARGERKIDEVEREIAIDGHGGASFSFEEILGRFVDASRAYRFGPADHDLITASVHRRRGDQALAQIFRFPAEHATGKTPISELGVTGQACIDADGVIHVLLCTRRFANGVRVCAANARPNDSWFGIEPGGTRRLLLTPADPATPPTSVSVLVMNGEGRLTFPIERRI